MKLGLQAMRPTTVFGLWSSNPEQNLKVVKFAERLGYDSVWTAEAAGTDAFVPLAFLAAHTTSIKLATGVAQLSARTPTVTAMTAATLDRLSNGRVILGLGASGPAVVEGWHGAAFDDPVGRTSEYIAIVREVIARRNPATASGPHYTLPYKNAREQYPSARLMFRPSRREIPIYVAAMGARNIQMAARAANGVTPAFFSPAHEEAFFAGTGMRHLPSGVELAPFVSAMIGPDLSTCLSRLKPAFAFWIGGMGSGSTNYYGDFAERLGFVDFPKAVQKLYRQGHRGRAAELIPDEFVDAVALCGPRERIRERLEMWSASGVTTMIMTGLDPTAIALLAELVL